MKRIALDKVLHKKIKVDIFPSNIFVYVGNTFKEAKSNFEKDFYTELPLPETVVARCQYSEKHNVIAIMLDINDPKLVEHIYHEALHAAGFIITSIGMTYNFDNDELLAYLQGYISDKILSFLKITYTVTQ